MSKRVIPQVGLSALLLICVLYYVQLDDVRATLERASVVLIIAGVVIQFLVRGVATFRMKVIADLQGMPLRHWDLFRILLITQFYSLLLPGTLAAGGATWLKYVQHGAAKDAALAAIILNRGISTAFLLFVGGAAWVWDRGPAGSGVLANLVLVAVLTLVMITPVTRARVTPRQTGPAGSSWRQALHGVLINLFAIRGMPPGGRVILIASSMGYELLGAGGMIVFAASLDVELTLAQALWMRAGLQILLMLPVSVAGLGVREVSLVAFGGLVGVDAADAFAWSLLIFSGLVILAMVGACMEVQHQSQALRAGSPKVGS
jgi:glycosyltransferase 2 family protein